MTSNPMPKSQAIALLGGTVVSTARACGVSPQAVTLWPDPLTQRITDRVQAALWRRLVEPRNGVAFSVVPMPVEQGSDPCPQSPASSS